MRAIDPNVIVRIVTRDEPEQADLADAFMDAEGAWVSALALTEAVWVLATVYDLSARDLGNAVEMLLNHRSLVIDQEEAVVSALQLFRKKPGLGFSDCMILELARKAGLLPLGTFDRALSKVDGAQRI